MLLATMTGCTEDITQAVGPLPDETSMNNVGSQLYSGKTFSNMITINMYEDDGPAIEKIGYALTNLRQRLLLLRQFHLRHLWRNTTAITILKWKNFPSIM